jgi:chemotaxis protein MotA
MDIITLLGFGVGIGGIVLGQLLEGGELGALVQFTAAFIVFGGTLGATLVSSTREDLRMALALLGSAFRGSGHEHAGKVEGEIVEAAKVARRESMLALEKRLPHFSDPFMQNVFGFMIDGVDPSALRSIFESEIDAEEERLMAGAKVFIDAGGFSPTIGILGAVLGLIQVMNNITDTSKLGAGIAVAFVATVYGVGMANLVLLPLGNKIRRKAKRRLEVKTMILEGAIGIASGLNPTLVHEKIRAIAGVPASAGRKRGRLGIGGAGSSGAAGGTGAGSGNSAPPASSSSPAGGEKASA